MTELSILDRMDVIYQLGIRVGMVVVDKENSVALVALVSGAVR